MKKVMRVIKSLGPRSIMRLKHLPAYMKDPSISLLKKGAIVLGLLYIISPVDAIPDVVPILGWLDDVGVLGILITSMMRELEDYDAISRQKLVE